MQKQTGKPITKILSLLLLAALLVSACAQATPTAQSTPTASEPTATAMPTSTPEPTLTPLPLPAPRLLSNEALTGAPHGLDQAITLSFDQPMDRASVESAMIISPTVEGTISWVDDRTVSFVPDGELDRGLHYEVRVDDAALSAEGKPLQESAAVAFTTVGFLTVSEVLPAHDTAELDPNTTVTVVFDRPVVPLTAINEQDELPQPLTFVPPVRGTGEWLNTSIYQFRPQEGFLPATQYKARVAAGLTDTLGGVLDEDYVWEFATIQPAVVRTWPAEGFDYMGPTDVISVTFNQPMDHMSVQEGFSLTSEDAQPVEGRFRWRGAESATDEETMVFVPDEPLPRGLPYTIKIDRGVQAKIGNMGTQKIKTSHFTTVPEPGIVTTSPFDGEDDVETQSSFRITFASPMERQGFMDYLSISPQVTNVYTYWSEYDTKVRIYWDREPASDYEVTLSGDAPDKYGAPLGELARVRFETGDLKPYAALNTEGRIGTFGTYTDTQVYATYRNVSQLDASLYRLDVPTFIGLNSSWEAWDDFAPDASDLIYEWIQPAQADRNEVGLARLDLNIGGEEVLPTGLYYLELTAPEVKALDQSFYRPSRYLFVKSGLNLTLKQTRHETLVWATDLSSGEPVAGVPLTLYDKSRQVDSGGRTDAQGLYIAEDLATEDLWRAFFALAGEPGDDNFALAYNDWDQGISPWNFDVSSEYWASDYMGYLYTDRPIYRPGQTVYFKGIVRGDDDAHYRLPQEVENLEVRIDDPQGKELYKSKLALNEMGTLNDQLLLDEEAALGTYYIEVQDTKLGLFVGTNFRVAEYKKPEYQVAVTTDRDAYLNGESINVSAEATYYFGGPVANAGVRWSVLSSDYSFRFQCPASTNCPWYSWTDYEWGSYDEDAEYYGYGQLLAEGEAETDDQGRVTFKVPADIAEKINSQVFTIEVSVTDLNGQQVSSRTAAIVHKAEFYTGVAPRGYLAEVGDEKVVDLVTVDWDSEPVADVPLTVVFLEHNWYSVRRQAEDGRYYWEWTAEDVPVFTTTVTTDDQGQAEASFVPPKAGSYRVRATGYDNQRNEVRSSAYLWVWGGSSFVSWRQESTSRIDLIADKEQYEVGDTAEILVPSPYTGTVQALITLERGHIMETEVRQLESNSEVLRIPITEDHVPNLFVSVVLVQGADESADQLATFKMGVVKLPVSVEPKQLAITVTPDKDAETGDHYRPRETATYDILVTDHQGEPVEAELSLRLADLAVLALADETGPTLLETFWRGRGLGVKTSMPLVVAMEPYNQEIEPRAKGGGGGDGEGLVRSRFADTAFWDAEVRTAEDGTAQVTVPLPDNLTTWRMQARGITAETQVGRSEVDIVSTLDLLVRPVLPRFFVVGDEAEIATIVHNNTDQDLDTEVALSAEGLAVSGETSRQITIAAGEQVKVTWPVTAQPGEQVKVRMWARSEAPVGEHEGLYDGREDTLPVYRYSTPEVVGTAGQLEEAGIRQEIVQLPDVLDPTQGELAVQIDGSLTAATQDALAYLETYPYSCVEQTISRFLPNVVTWQAMQEMGVERPELEQKLAQMVGSALQRLYNEQHYDGGWGWWVSDSSHPYLTAYALHAMIEADRAGFVVDADVMDKAAAYLSKELPSVGRIDSHWEANRLAYQLYVLADYGTLSDTSVKQELGLAVRLFEKRHLLSRYGQATLALALHLLDSEDPARVQTLVADLASDAVFSATGAHWEETEPDYWNMNTDIRTTAIVLWSMARLDPESDLLPNSVRWLMAAREQGHWATTQTTSWSLLGLVAYMRASGEMAGDYSYAVYLNGELLDEGDISEENIDESQKLRVDIARLLASEADAALGEGGNRLVIERQPAGEGQSGKGQLYYTAHLRYYLPADHVRALDRGILVARQYSPVDDIETWVDEAQVGDVVRVKLTIIAPTDLHYVIVEDPLPAGFEGVDLSLKTTSVIGERPQLRNVTAEEESWWYRTYGWGWWWFSHSEMRDEKVALFAQYLPRGTYEYTYLMRASVPGEFLTMPATAYEMYFPEVFGRSDGGKFTVTAAE